MGDPKRLRKKFAMPSHPWQKQRIDDEKVLMKEYGFKNKRELWKLNSVLSKYKRRVKGLVQKDDPDSNKEKQELILKLQGFGVLGQEAVLEDILSLSLKDLCERRLQTIVYRKSLANSIKQSRQFITHEHIVIGNQKITSPSYLVNMAEAALVNFSGSSPIFSENHPERSIQRKLKEDVKKTKKSKEDDKELEEIRKVEAENE